MGKPRRKNRALLLVGVGVLVGAIVLVMYVFDMLVLSNIRYGGNVTDQQVAELLQDSMPASAANESASSTTSPTVPAPTFPTQFQPLADGSLAVIEIPRFGEDYRKWVMEGSDTSVLDTGVAGHYPGTAMPCQIGNFSISGHRSTYGKPFAQIQRLAIGDTIVVRTSTATCTYAVTSHHIVTPDRTEVIAEVPNQPGVSATEAMMTITTCHPWHSTSQRYVVHATLVEQTAN